MAAAGLLVQTSGTGCVATLLAAPGGGTSGGFVRACSGLELGRPRLAELGQLGPDDRLAVTLAGIAFVVALVVLFREANAEVPEVAAAEVSTLRGQLFKVGAVVQTSVRRIWFHFSSTWPRRCLFARVCEAVDCFAAQLIGPASMGVPP